MLLCDENILHLAIYNMLGAAVHPSYFFTCLTPNDFTHQWGALQLNGFNNLEHQTYWMAIWQLLRNYCMLLPLHWEGTLYPGHF